ncbi:MAG: DUF2188 domain-containing protein [Hyphomicrobiales bacterium]|nr:MAG: DUF2188 domain-containing protein [Hyphomicrobiales bacterium]
MARKQFFVSPDGGNWKVQSEGVVLSRHSLKSAAIRAAVDAAHAWKGDAQVMVQREDGTFQIEWTYGHDPYPPKG